MPKQETFSFLSAVFIILGFVSDSRCYPEVLYWSKAFQLTKWNKSENPPNSMSIEVLFTFNRDNLWEWKWSFVYLISRNSCLWKTFWRASRTWDQSLLTVESSSTNLLLLGPRWVIEVILYDCYWLFVDVSCDWVIELMFCVLFLPEVLKTGG